MLSLFGLILYIHPFFNQTNRKLSIYGTLEYLGEKGVM